MRLPVALLVCLSAGAVLVGAAGAGCAPRPGGGEAAGPGDDANAAASPAVGADTLLTLDRSPCFGACPSYHLTVFGDGRVVYTGRRYVERTDTVRARIPEAKVQRLAERFHEADYFDYQRSYGQDDPECAVHLTDHPTVRTSFRWKGRRQRVQHYHGCYARRTEGGGYERSERLARLTALEDTVDAIVGTARWTGVEEQ